MADRIHKFEEIFSAQDPLATYSFQLLLEEITKETDPRLLQVFFVHLNDELYRVLWGDKEKKKVWTQEILHVLLTTNRELTIKALKDLMGRIELNYYDPLMQVVFAASSQSTPLLALLRETVQTENQLLALRIRVLEAIFMKRSQQGKSPGILTEARDALHFLNEVLSQKKEIVSGIKDLKQSLSGRFKAIRKILSNLDAQSWRVVATEAGFSLQGCGGILEIVLGALEKLAENPRAPETTRMVLEILKANIPLPVWHSAAAPIVARMIRYSQNPRHPQDAHRDNNSRGVIRISGNLRLLEQAIRHLPQDDTHIIVSLIIDKAIELVLTVADAKWYSTVHQKVKQPVREMISFDPSDPSWLESVLLDQNSPLKVRMMAAALLRILSDAFPSIWLTPRVEFYSDLFLHPLFRPVQDKPERRLNISLIDTEEKIPFLLEAVNERADFVRLNAARACYAAAQDHPGWFLPEHHIRLLPLLSDSHHHVRLNIARTFKTLTLHPSQRMVTVIQDISKRLNVKPYQIVNETSAQQELEAALAVVFDDLCQQVDHLQQQVQWLEANRRTLLDHIEKQALRIGEEIHHEILNTRCGYLATSIDEESYAEAKQKLEELVTDLRRIMNNLYPKDLEAEGFLITIQKRLEDAKKLIQRRRPEFTVKFDCSEEITDEHIMKNLRDEAHLVLLYRIVLEAISNARKHAHGTFIAVQVHRPKMGLINIAISDNGSGNGAPFQENVGLALMRQRAQEIGAEIEYRKTSQAGGTTVVIHLPQLNKAVLP